MAVRHPFGGGVADWIFTKDADNRAVFSGGAVLQFWNTRDGGTQYTDLAMDVNGGTPAAAITTSDGTDGYEIGSIPVFYGPSDVTQMWVSADGGTRQLIQANDVGALAGDAATQLTQHVSAVNPHGVGVSTLVDTALPATVPNGALLAFDTASSKWTAASDTGLNPADFVKTAGGSTIRIPDGNITRVAQDIRIPAGDRAAAPDTWRVYLNTGTDAAPIWTLVTWLNSYGDLRAQASSDSRVAFKVHRRSAGASADIAQFASEAGTPLAWVNAKGSVRAPNLARSVTFTRTGAVTAGVGKFHWHNLGSVELVLSKLIFFADTPGTTQSTFDVNLNGTTLYPSGKPTLAANAQSSGILSAAFTIPPGGRISVDVDVAGTSLADLSCQLDLS